MPQGLVSWVSRLPRLRTASTNPPPDPESERVAPGRLRRPDPAAPPLMRHHMSARRPIVAARGRHRTDLRRPCRRLPGLAAARRRRRASLSRSTVDPGPGRGATRAARRTTCHAQPLFQGPRANLAPHPLPPPRTRQLPRGGSAAGHHFGGTARPPELPTAPVLTTPATRDSRARVSTAHAASRPRCPTTHAASRPTLPHDPRWPTAHELPTVSVAADGPHRPRRPSQRHAPVALAPKHAWPSPVPRHDAGPGRPGPARPQNGDR
jgi:hypothetical protein